MLYDIRQYDGPLDLLSHLIEENRADIQDLPIAEITGQYLEILEASSRAGIDMELASEFILMGSTLLQIKSLLLLPERSKEEAGEGPDPREELVLRLMAYRRIKLLAGELEKRFAAYGFSLMKPAETPERLGIEVEMVRDACELDKFEQAVTALANRNALRFGEKNMRIKRLLKREKFSVREKMSQIMDWLRTEKRFFFGELFSADKSPRAERVSAFLAVLELLRENKIKAEQKAPFAVILLERVGIKRSRKEA